MKQKESFDTHVMGCNVLNGVWYFLPKELCAKLAVKVQASMASDSDQKRKDLVQLAIAVARAKQDEDNNTAAEEIHQTACTLSAL